jgi:aminopeptidase N
MKKIIVLLCLFLSPAFYIAQTNSTFQQRQSTIDTKHLVLDLKFDWQKKQAYGIVTIRFSPIKKTNKITLDAGKLSIHSIKLKDGTALQFQYDGGDKNDGLEIFLNRLYETNEEITLLIDYNTNWVNESDPNAIWGSFGKGLRFFAPTITTPLKRKQIWSNGEPQSNRYWFPAYDDINDLRTTEFIGTVEKPLMLLSNGNLISQKENLDGTRTFHYKTESAYPNYLTSVVVGEYIDVKQNYNGIELHTFGYPDEKEAIEATVVRLPEMVKYFSETTGINYPFKQYSQIVVQDYPFPGQNAPHTASILSDNFIDDYKTHADFFYLWDGVESQALASQWFGNLITPSSWEHIWLNNAFSHYFDGLFTDYRNGHDEFLTYYLPYDHLLVFGDWNSGLRHPIVTNQFEDLTAFTSDNHSRARGALVLRMLRKELGEENWWKSLRYYFKTNAGKMVSTSDFQTAIEKTTGESIAWFFDQWIYKTGHPVFEISKEYDAVKKQLVLKVKQNQVKDSAGKYAENQFYKGKVEIEIDGKISVIKLEAKAMNEFRISSAEAPHLIHFDFESTWIKEMAFKKSQEELLYQLRNDKDILGKRFAITELVKIAQNEKTPTSEIEKIKRTLRETTESSSYWRFRLFSLAQLINISPLPYETSTNTLLLKLIETDKPWIRTWAINYLGMSNDSQYVDLYIEKINTDSSERVVNAAAIALGKTKNSKAFEALVLLKDKPSWKSQSLISCLAGLKELGDPRGSAIAYEAIRNNRLPRWWLATSVWDYPLAAAETLVALGKADTAYTIAFERFRQSLTENDRNDIFGNALLIVTLADPRGQEIFGILREKFKEDPNTMVAIENLEVQFKENTKTK